MTDTGDGEAGSTTTRGSDGADGLAAIGHELADDAVRLVRAEINLAKAQLREAAVRMAVGIACFLVAAVLLLLFFVEAASAVPAHYSGSIFGNDWLGWVAFGGVFLVLALLLAFVGYRLLRHGVKEGKATQQQLKEDAEWLKGLTKRGSSES